MPIALLAYIIRKGIMELSEQMINDICELNKHHYIDEAIVTVNDSGTEITVFYDSTDVTILRYN